MILPIDTRHKWYCKRKVYANGWNVWSCTISSPILFACSSFHSSTTYYLQHGLHSRYEASSGSSLQTLQSTLLRHRNAEVCRGGSPCQPRSQDNLQLRSTGNHHQPHPQKQPHTCTKLTQICPQNTVITTMRLQALITNTFSAVGNDEFDWKARQMVVHVSFLTDFSEQVYVFNHPPTFSR